MLVPTLVLLTTYQALATAGSAPTPPDCSLNGEKRGGVCVCDKPWSGPDCSTLNFKPVTFPQGYGMAPKLTSWGGNAIEDPQTGKYHIFVSAMTNNCTLQTWGKNSRIEHGIADTITGPYKFVDVAIPTWSHNSAPIALKDGTFAIVHIGTGVGPVDGGANCSNQPPPAPPVQTPCKGLASLPGWNCSAHVCAGDGHTDPGQCGPDLGEPQLDCKLDDDQGCAAAAAKVCAATKGCTAFGLSHIWEGGRAAKLFSSSKVLTNNPDWSVWSKVPQAESSVSAPAAGSTIHTATSLNGPWVPLMKNTLGSCNNPAPWVHKNGTIYCLCGNTVLRSENISGPWAHISSLSHSGGPAGSYEDPFLYTDERGWHLIYHVVSVYLYAEYYLIAVVARNNETIMLPL